MFLSIRKNSMYQFLFMLTIAATIGLQGWRTLFNNFAVEVGDLNSYQVGAIQSIREIPGFLSMLTIFILIFIKEHILSALSVLLMGVGILLTGFFPSFMGIMLTTLLMSLGFHFFETTNQSLTLQYFNKEEAPLVFGKLRGYGALGNIVIGALIWIFSNYLSFKTIYLIVGIIIIFIGVWAILKDPSRSDIPVQKKKMIMRREYWLFYVLTFLSGARRQIFVVFSVFLMVKVYHFSLQMVTILFIINNMINYFLNPMIGKWIIKFGEKRLLTIEYSSLILIFLAYAFVPFGFVIAILYVLDHIFFNFSIAIRTYFQKIADKKDIAPSMAVGFTINHIVAVIIPLLGGLLWLIDFKIPFIIGSALSLCSLLFVRQIRVENY